MEKQQKNHKNPSILLQRIFKNQKRFFYVFTKLIVVKCHCQQAEPLV